MHCHTSFALIFKSLEEECWLGNISLPCHWLYGIERSPFMALSLSWYHPSFYALLNTVVMMSWGVHAPQHMWLQPSAIQLWHSVPGLISTSQPVPPSLCSSLWIYAVALWESLTSGSVDHLSFHRSPWQLWFHHDLLCDYSHQLSATLLMHSPEPVLLKWWLCQQRTTCCQSALGPTSCKSAWMYFFSTLTQQFSLAIQSYATHNNISFCCLL